MPFHKNLLSNPHLSEILQKRIGFSPYILCEFYEGFEVLQIQGNESKEYFFGNYFNGKYCGSIYLGDQYTSVEVARICEKYMPKKWEEIPKYVIDFGGEVSYWKFHKSQYAFLMESVMKKM